MDNWVKNLLPELWTPIGDLGVEFCVHRLEMCQDGSIWVWSGMFMIRWRGQVTSTYCYQKWLREQTVRRYVYEQVYAWEQGIKEGKIVAR